MERELKITRSKSGISWNMRSVTAGERAPRQIEGADAAAVVLAVAIAVPGSMSEFR